MNAKTESEILTLGRQFKAEHSITKWSQKFNSILIAKLAIDFGMDKANAKAFAESIAHIGLAGNASQFGQKLDEKEKDGKPKADLSSYFDPA